MPDAKTAKYSFAVVPHPGEHPLSLGMRRARDDEDAKRVAAIEARNEQSRQGLGPAARITVRRSDGSLAGDYACTELLAAVRT